MELISNERRNSVFDEMKMRVYNQKNQEELRAKLNLEGTQRKEKLDMIEEEYIANLFKLDDIAELASRDIDLQRKFMEMKLAFENTDMSEKNKVEAIITSASVLNRIDTRVEDLSTSEFSLLVSALVPISIEKYNEYGELLSHPIVLRAILDKTDDFVEQRGICYQLIRSFQKHPYGYLDNELYQKVVMDAINLVNAYPTTTKKKIR